MGTKRPLPDEYFMQLAHLVSSRSTCLRKQIGAVLVKDNRILSTGYNGAPTGIKHCKEVGCAREGHGAFETYLSLFDEHFNPERLTEIRNFFPKKGEIVPSGYRHELCRGVHAEQNTIIQAAVFGVSIRGAILYSTVYPCVICAKMLINAEIAKVVYDADYVDPLSKKILDESNIKVSRFKKKPAKGRNAKGTSLMKEDYLSQKIIRI